MSKMAMNRSALHDDLAQDTSNRDIMVPTCVRNVHSQGCLPSQTAFARKQFAYCISFTVAIIILFNKSNLLL